MDSKLSRIATFIESLPNDSDLGDCQSTLLPTNMNSYGGITKNGGDCNNYSAAKCKKSKNGGNCVNYQGCTDTTNEASCINDDYIPVPPMPDPKPMIPAT